MAYVKMSDLYAKIHEVLRTDEVILSLLGVDADDAVTLAKRIQKRQKPSGITTASNFPLISFYTLPGRREYNHLVYETAFDFDIYTADDVEKAMDIADRIGELFDDKFIELSGGSSFKAEWLTSSEVGTDLENTYQFFTQILFPIGIER